MFSYRLSDTAELRLLTMAQAQAIYDRVERDRQHLRKWLPWVDATHSLQEQQEYIRGAMDQYARNEGFQASIWSEGQLAGMIGFHGLQRHNRSISLGYWLGSEFQGRGLMTLSAQAMTTYALRDMRLNRIEIQAATGNTRSRAVAERLGYTLEGILRQAEWLNGHFVDHCLYAMLAEDWHPK